MTPEEQKLIKGVAVVIDDKIDDGEDVINSIITQLDDVKIPVLKFNKIEDAIERIQNLSNISFIILDWIFYDEVITGLGGSMLKSENAKKVVEFIKKMKDQCLCPIFISSDNDTKEIINEIKEIDDSIFLGNEKNDYIFINDKNYLRDKGVIALVIGWIANNPSLYTIKNWDYSFNKSKNNTFWDLYKNSPNWPTILWNSFKLDKVEESGSLNEAIFKIIRSKTIFDKLEEAKVLTTEAVGVEESKRVYYDTKIVDKLYLSDNEFKPGDIFKDVVGYEGKYLLNIRPACDTIIGRPGFDKELYLIIGEIKDPKYIFTSEEIHGLPGRNQYNKYGVTQRDNDFLLLGLDSNDCVLFCYKKIVIKNIEEIKEKRIARLSSPKIDFLHNKFSSYISRAGMPRVPDEIVRHLIEK